MTFQFRIDPSALKEDDILYFEDANGKNSQYRCQLCEGVITTVQYGEAVNGTTPPERKESVR